MSFSPLSTSAAATKLKVDLIENGIGTQALHETVVAYQANRRAGTHSTKTKATVAGSGKKPNKNVKQLALRKAISSRVNAGEVYLIEPISLSKPKTRDLLASLKGNLD